MFLAHSVRSICQKPDCLSSLALYVHLSGVLRGVLHERQRATVQFHLLILLHDHFVVMRGDVVTPGLGWSTQTKPVCSEANMVAIMIHHLT